METTTSYLRPAHNSDIVTITSILSYYVETSTATFRLEKPSISEINTVLSKTQSFHLPFLVAIKNHGTDTAKDFDHNQENHPPVDESIIGYAYVLPWRGEFPAYQYTVELSVYVAPWCGYRQGVGKSLVDAILSELRIDKYEKPAQNFLSNISVITGQGALIAGPEISGTARITGTEANSRYEIIREILAVVAVNSDEKIAHGQRRFYEACGFKEIGLMKSVGWKFERWLVS